MSSWVNIPPFAVQQVTSVSKFDNFLDDIITLASHTHTTGCPGDGASKIGLNALGSNPYHVAPGLEPAFFPFLPDDQFAWSRISPCPAARNGGTIVTNFGVSGCGACIVWSVLLHTRGGTTACPLVYIVAEGNPSSACIAACIGGSPLLVGGLSRFDLYATNAGCMWDINYDHLPQNVASGIYQIKILTLGANGSSAGFQAGIAHIVTGFT